MRLRPLTIVKKSTLNLRHCTRNKEKKRCMLYQTDLTENKKWDHISRLLELNRRMAARSFYITVRDFGPSMLYPVTDSLAVQRGRKRSDPKPWMNALQLFDYLEHLVLTRCVLLLYHHFLCRSYLWEISGSARLQSGARVRVCAQSVFTLNVVYTFEANAVKITTTKKSK